MTAIVKKLRRRRKLSSDLDPRWGDPSISPPNEGSWSQHERQSVTVSPAPPQVPELNNGHGRNHSFDRQSNLAQPRRSPHPNDSKASGDSSPNIPLGYYDAGVRSRYGKKPQASPELPPPAPREHTAVALPKTWEDGNFDDSSEEEAECDDDVSSLGARPGLRDESDIYSRAAKSPPLSITSRMRRNSAQSTATDAVFSVPPTASSKRTSFTSSVPGDPRLVRNSPYHDKMPSLPHRANIQDSVAPIPRQELVPSYDDLYG